MSYTPNTDKVELFLKNRTTFEKTDHEVWRDLCAKMDVLLGRYRNALEVADESLALIEDVGHGAMSDNVTCARGVIDDVLSNNLTLLT